MFLLKLDETNAPQIAEVNFSIFNHEYVLTFQLGCLFIVCYCVQLFSSLNAYFVMVIILRRLVKEFVCATKYSQNFVRSRMAWRSIGSDNADLMDKLEGKYF